jgi:hypothetical protein
MTHLDVLVGTLQCMTDQCSCAFTQVCKGMLCSLDLGLSFLGAAINNVAGSLAGVVGLGSSITVLGASK